MVPSFLDLNPPSALQLSSGVASAGFSYFIAPAAPFCASFGNKIGLCSMVHHVTKWVRNMSSTFS